MTAGAWVLIVAIVAALAIGLARAFTNGRFRGTRSIVPNESPVDTAGDGDVRLGLSILPSGELGERATLLQFSSAFCAPCRATRRTLEEVAGVVPGVRHVEVDAESHLQLVRALNILRTPTTVVLDAGGREVTRASGAPRRDQVMAALESALS